MCSTLVLQKGLSLLEDLPVGPLLVLQSSLRVCIDEGKRVFRQDMRQFLLGVSAEVMERFIALNEICGATFSCQNAGESRVMYTSRLMGAACLYMRVAMGLDIVALCVTEDDIAFRVCKDLGIPVRTLRDHINATVMQSDERDVMMSRLVDILEANDEKACTLVGCTRLIGLLSVYARLCKPMRSY